jgi:hypothetical protein
VRPKTYSTGQLLVKKWSKQGIAFRDVGPGAYNNTNLVFISEKDQLVFLDVKDEVYRAKNVSFARVLSKHGVIFFPIEHLMTLSEHEREIDLGHL